MKKQRHHYLPQFYLRGFSAENKQGSVWVYEKGHHEPKLVSVRDAAVIKKYYSTENENGIQISGIEDGLAQLEGNVAPLLEKLKVSDQTLSAQQTQLLLSFASLMVTRIPTFRNSVGKLVREITRLVTKMMAADEKRWEALLKGYERDSGERIDVPIDELREFALSDDRYVIEIHPNEFVRLMAHGSRSIYGLFTRMRWSFLKSDNASPFITSDTPVIPYVPGASPNMPIGFGMKRVEVSFPISRRLCMLGKYHGSEGFLSVDTKTVGDINSRTLSGAKRFLFTSFESRRLQEEFR
jgi:hypothetical protein